MLSHFSHVQLFAILCTVAYQGAWDFPGKNTGMDCHALLQGIFPTQKLKPHLLWLPHWRQNLYHWATWEAPQDPYSASLRQEQGLPCLFPIWENWFREVKSLPQGQTATIKEGRMKTKLCVPNLCWGALSDSQRQEGVHRSSFSEPPYSQPPGLEPGNEVGWSKAASGGATKGTWTQPQLVLTLRPSPDKVERVWEPCIFSTGLSTNHKDSSGRKRPRTHGAAAQENNASVILQIRVLKPWVHEHLQIYMSWVCIRVVFPWDWIYYLV